MNVSLFLFAKEIDQQLLSLPSTGTNWRENLADKIVHTRIRTSTRAYLLSRTNQLAYLIRETMYIPTLHIHSPQSPRPPPTAHALATILIHMYRTILLLGPPSIISTLVAPPLIFKPASKVILRIPFTTVPSLHDYTYGVYEVGSGVVRELVDARIG